MARWEISDEQRQQVIDSLMAIVRSNDWPCAIRAARVLILMDELNVRYEPTENAEFRDRLHKMLTRLKDTKDN